MIQFLLNDTPVEVENCLPSTSMLDWLRTKVGKTGTKEGCATGDCGACTILVGEEVLDDTGNMSWQYKSLNSCLLLLGNAHGKHIVTVEALSAGMSPELVDLHPVQRAMVECHGSQCGFCTPGIVMSLLALYLNNKSYPGKSATIHALGGNLCRCTGYNPILAAAEKAFEYDREDNFLSATAIKFKQELTHSSSPFLQHENRRFCLPQSTDELVALKSLYPEAKLVAGGTDLSIELSQNLLEPETFISTIQVPDLTKLTISDDQLEIGAAVPYNEFVGALCEEYPEAKELFERLGSTQVRNSGTLGGSLGNASPIGDPAPLLIALNAEMKLVSIDEERTVKVEEFFVDYRKTILKPNETIKSVVIPKRSEKLRLACHKLSKRFEDDISTVCLVIALEKDGDVISNPRCAMGGMAAIPARAKHIEQALNNAEFTLQSFIVAGDWFGKDFQPMTDVRATAEYRLTACSNLMHRIGFELCNTIPVMQVAETQTRISHASL